MAQFTEDEKIMRRLAAIKDLFMDIASEELSHMEIVGTLINLLNGHDVNYKNIANGTIEAQVLTGLNPGLTNASGYSWTSDYVSVTGDLCADLLSNIASEQRAKVVYEYLYRQIEDKYVREAIDFLLNREEAHNAMFRLIMNLKIVILAIQNLNNMSELSDFFT